MKSINKKLAVLLSATFLAFPLITFAIYPIGTIIQNVIDMILLPLFGGAAIIMTFYAAFLFLSANGDPAKFKEARKIFLLVVLGIIIAAAAEGILAIIKTIFGLS